MKRAWLRLFYKPPSDICTCWWDPLWAFSSPGRAVPALSAFTHMWGAPVPQSPQRSFAGLSSSSVSLSVEIIFFFFLAIRERKQNRQLWYQEHKEVKIFKNRQKDTHRVEAKMSGEIVIFCSTASRNLTAHKTFCFKSVLQHLLWSDYWKVTFSFSCDWLCALGNVKIYQGMHKRGVN